MTTTEHHTTKNAITDAELRWLPLSALVAHPDNPRASLGDVTELVRSIRSHGVLEPLVVLPAADDGLYRIVAGHRRHAAAAKAGVEEVAVVVREMTDTEVIEAMLSENTNRSDLSLTEEVRAIERLMSLDAGLTPAKLCKRIGRSQAWVRSRMAVTVLPVRWRAAIDDGELSLVAAEAAAGAADLGPEHLDAVCERLVGQRWGDPVRTVANYRDDLRRDAAYAEAVERARRRAGTTVFTDDEPLPERTKRLSDLFDSAGAKAHSSEPCHGVVLRRVSWGSGIDRYDICTDPRRHRRAKDGDADRTRLVADRARAGNADDGYAKRKGRLARIDHATQVWARPRGVLSQADLVRLGLHALVHEAGREALGYAATILGRETPRDITAEQLLADVDAPAALARVAGAVALGLAESRMYWSASEPRCREYLNVLTRTGWTPDEWTAATLTDPHRPGEPARDEVEDEIGDDDLLPASAPPDSEDDERSEDAAMT